MIKRLISLAMVLATFLLFFGGCTQKHICDFSVQSTEEKFLRSAASCSAQATYYYSCACGAAGEEFFEAEGTLLTHLFAENTDAKYYKAAGNCQIGAEYYYSCANCGEASTETFFDDATYACVFDQEVVGDKYLRSEATADSAASYYRSCRGCGKAGEEFFFDGEPLGAPPKQPDPEDLPRSFFTELLDFRSDFYEIRWCTDNRPTKPTLRIRSESGAWEQHSASIVRMPNGLGYMMQVRLALSPSSTYLYEAYDASTDLGSETRTLQTQDTDSMTRAYLMGAYSSQMFGIVMMTKHYTIVFDGGWMSGDGERLAELIRSKGGSRVDAWFLTHPHQDHVGAFYYVATSCPEIGIGTVYYNMPTVEDLAAYGRGGTEADVWKNILSLFENDFRGRLHVTKKNELFGFDGVTVKVLRVYNPELTKGDFGNEASSVFRVENKRSSLLILGDIGPLGIAEVMKECSRADLETEYVQMAHHGQAGASQEFYEYIVPEKCLWPTPDWLWDNNLNGQGYNTGPWGTLKTRQWMKDLGVTEHYVAKDGTQQFPF